MWQWYFCSTIFVMAFNNIELSILRSKDSSFLNITAGATEDVTSLTQSWWNCFLFGLDEKKCVLSVHMFRMNCHMVSSLLFRLTIMLDPVKENYFSLNDLRHATIPFSCFFFYNGDPNSGTLIHTHPLLTSRAIARGLLHLYFFNRKIFYMHLPSYIM